MSRRYVVFGAGAIGGVVGARLHQAGHEVALIARGAHLAAIQERGLRLLSPAEDATLPIPAAADPGVLGVGRDGDVVLLCVKSQDTREALALLRAAGADVPIVCLQNGVANERMALRRFADVYAAVLLAPTTHLEPGVVEADGGKLTGLIDIGRYPSGVDALAAELGAALDGAGFRARVLEDVMRPKYAKLLLNLGNAVTALFAASPARDELAARVVAEGTAVLDGAGIDHHDADVMAREDRWRELGVAPVAGRTRSGSSTWQSLARGAGAIETDYLNGEIALLGRLHGIPVPLNAALCRVAHDHAARGGAPEELSVEELDRAGAT